MSSISLLLVLSISLLLSGCGEPAGGLVFAVGGAPAELAVWEQVAKNFRQKTGISLSIRRMPSDSAQQRQSLLAAMRSEQPDPDVFLMDVAWVGLFASAGWLHPLLGMDRGPFFPRLLEQVDVHDGELVALPIYMDAGLLYYRTDLLDEAGLSGPPTTWEELAESAARVQQAMRDKIPEFYGFVWQGAQYEGLVVNFLDFAGQAGGLPQEAQGVRCDLPANVSALERMRAYIREKRISPPNTYTEMREENVRIWFQSGKAMYERNWPYAWALHQSEGSPVRGKVGVAPLPAPEGGEAAPTLGGYHIGISAFSDAPAEARRFVEYIVSWKVMKRIVLELGWNPGRSDLYDDPELRRKMGHLAALRETFANARPRPPIPYYSQLSIILQRHLNACLAGDMEAGAALDRTQFEIDMLERRYARRGE